MGLVVRMHRGVLYIKVLLLSLPILTPLALLYLPVMLLSVQFGPSKTVQDGIWRPIAFTSRALTETDQCYSVGKCEALACVGM